MIAGFFPALISLAFCHHIYLVSPMPVTNNMKNLRVELFFKGKKELKERVQFLSQYGVNSFNLVNKSRKDTIKEWVDEIRCVLPESSICAHYSLKYNKSASRMNRDDASYEIFSSFVQSFHNENDPVDMINRNEVLLISGSGEKVKLDPINTLQRLKAEKIVSLPKIAVAYNPFFQNEQQREVEKERLLEKLATQQVDKVYLQFGTDLELLRSALTFLAELRSDDKFKCISGSIFLPTKKLIAQQKFRPWNGVFLSEEFLQSPENAHQIVVKMMKLYKDYNCEILIEAPGVRNEKDMLVVEKLLEDRDAPQPVTAQQNSGSPINYNLTELGKRRKLLPVNGIDKVPLLTPSSLVSAENLNKPAILLFGPHDVRVHDNEAFQQASFHSHVIPVFLWSESHHGHKWGITGAVEVVLKDALRNLKRKLQNHDLDLLCRNVNDIDTELLQLCDETGSSTVYYNKEFIPQSRVREESIEYNLLKRNILTVPCQSSLLYDPVKLSLSSGFNGGHWGTLMPFLKGCKKQLGEPRLPIQKHETFALLEKMSGPIHWPAGIDVENLDMGLVDGKEKWDLPILQKFSMSEDRAMEDMETFMKHGFRFYEKERSRADLNDRTSVLSPHLRIGTLSPNELYYKVENSALPYEQKKTFSRRLFWRELAYYQLLNFPKMCYSSIRSHYDNTEWCSGDEGEKRFEAWKTGQTGYPLVDAGMRELYQTGWMTQSVRMVVASFLTEYLRVNWIKGCEWFHYTLADADCAINAMMWQNAGRSGTDQWNFVMSPVAASQDQTGEYTKKWVPELSNLNKPLLHKPWEAPNEVLSRAGIILGETYPHRIVVDLKTERAKSVESVLTMRRNSQEYNDKKGYDLITLPDGSKTVVFTKKEYRIDSKGKTIPVTTSRKPINRRGKTRSSRGRQNVK